MRPLVIIPLSIVIFLFAFVAIWHGLHAKPFLVTTTVVVASDQTTSDIPVRIIIPAIGVNAPLEDLGLTPTGALAVPMGPTDAAWFDLGPRPGEEGSAVIVGHEGWKDDIEAVFDNLHELQPGDKIYVQDGTGVTTTFVVRVLQTYAQNANVPNVFNSSDGKAHLNLITCEGTWNAAQQSYADRLVVFADASS